MRMCTGCRAVSPQRELVRLAFDSGRLVIDRARRLPGRGAYVHPIAACVTIAGLSKSLRKGVSKPDVERIVGPDCGPTCSLHNENAGTETDFDLAPYNARTVKEPQQRPVVRVGIAPWFN